MRAKSHHGMLADGDRPGWSCAGPADLWMGVSATTMVPL
jgi:hypothetical protein